MNSSISNFSEEDFNEHRRYLYRYAIAQLRNSDAADEAVQETLLAAVEAFKDFQGRSSVRTWLTTILRNKIIDAKRREIRSPIIDVVSSSDEENLEHFDELFFQQDGHWQEEPSVWHNPEKCLENTAFWKIFEECLDNLPTLTAKAFYLKEIHGLETENICKDLEITTSNYWVMLYRARMSLRKCLEKNWFCERE